MVFTYVTLNQYQVDVNVSRYAMMRRMHRAHTILCYFNYLAS